MRLFVPVSTHASIIWLRFVVACISCYIRSHGDFVQRRKYIELYETVLKQK